MNARTEILELIRRRRLPLAPAPELSESWIVYEDRRQQFGEVLGVIGGAFQTAGSPAELEAAIRSLACFDAAKPIVCTAAGLSLGNRQLDGVDDPHALNDVELAILPGEFAVAENGAVWVTDKQLPLRALYFITQHLVLVIPRDAIVNNLHEAYHRLSFHNAGYGVFISGPSKTADIEQSLVIGAHGPRSTTVIMTDF